jgi:hypothetical protein
MPVGRNLHALLLPLLGLAALLPLLLADIPPLVDYLNHIARDYVLAHFEQSEILPIYYRPEWAFLPNLAMDLFIVPLTRIMPIDAAGKLFIGMTFLATAGGVLALSRALHGRIEWPAYLVFFFLYHRLMLWGYLNFSFGIGLALLAFALWLSIRNKPWLLRCLVFTGLALILLLCHLFTFAVYLLFIGGYQLGQTVQDWNHGALRRDLREWSLIFLHVAIPLALFVLLSPTAGKSGEIRFGSIVQKFTSAFHVVNNYSRPLDYATFLAIAGFIALGLWRKWLSLSLAVIAPLILGGLIQTVMPETLFGSQTADSRLPIALWMLLAAGLRFNPAARRVATPLLLGFLALLLARFAVIAVEWHRSNAVYAEYLAAFRKLPQGARLLSVVALPRNPSFHHPPVNFIASRAVIGKSTFDPFMFADRGHQPLAYAEGYKNLATATPGPIVYYGAEALSAGRTLQDFENPFREEILRQYDYLLMIDGRIFRDLVLERLQPVHTGNHFVLYRIDHRSLGP